MLKVTLEDIMSDHPIKVKESVAVGGAVHLLLRYRINGLLIISDKNENKLCGVFTTTDALRLLDEAIKKGHKRIEELKKYAESPVGKFARTDIVCLQKNMKVSKAIAIMHKKNIHTLPIFDNKKLVGVVGRHDLLNIAFS